MEQWGYDNLSIVFVLLVFGVLGHNITLSVQLLFCGPSEHKMLENLHKTELPESTVIF